MFNVDKVVVWMLLASWGTAQTYPLSVVAAWTVVGLHYIPTSVILQ